MMLPVYSFLSKSIVKEDEFDLSFITNLEVRENFVSQYISRMDSYSKRRPKSKTRNQSEVSGTTAKPYKQKGTGNARQGTKRGAQHTGGGTMFGPRGLPYKISVPKNEVKLMKRVLLSLALSQGRVFVVEDCSMSDHKTKTSCAVVSNFGGVDGRLFVIHDNETSQNNFLSSRNIFSIRYGKLQDFQVKDLLHSNCVLITKKAMLGLSNHF